MNQVTSDVYTLTLLPRYILSRSKQECDMTLFAQFRASSLCSHVLTLKANSDIVIMVIHANYNIFQVRFGPQYIELCCL